MDVQYYLMDSNAGTRTLSMTINLPSAVSPEGELFGAAAGYASLEIGKDYDGRVSVPVSITPYLNGGEGIVWLVGAYSYGPSGHSLGMKTCSGGCTITITAQGTIKRYARMAQSTSTDEQSTYSTIGWTQRKGGSALNPYPPIQPELPQYSHIDFEDRVETYTVTINGGGINRTYTTTATGDGIGTGVGIGGDIGCCVPSEVTGNLVQDENGEWYIASNYHNEPPHRTPVGGCSLGVSGTYSRYIDNPENNNVCPETKTYSFHSWASGLDWANDYQTYSIGNGTFSVDWSIDGNQYDWYPIMPWYLARFMFCDYCGPYTVGESSDLKNMDLVPRSSSITGVERKSHLVQTLLEGMPPEPTEYWSQTVNWNGQTEAPIYKENYEFNASGLEEPLPYPVSYTGRLWVWVGGESEDFQDTQAYSYGFQHGNRTINNILPTYTGNPVPDTTITCNYPAHLGDRLNTGGGYVTVGTVTSSGGILNSFYNSMPFTGTASAVASAVAALINAHQYGEFGPEFDGITASVTGNIVRLTGTNDITSDGNTFEVEQSGWVEGSMEEPAHPPWKPFPDMLPEPVVHGVDCSNIAYTGITSGVKELQFPIPPDATHIKFEPGIVLFSEPNGYCSCHVGESTYNFDNYTQGPSMPWTPVGSGSTHYFSFYSPDDTGYFNAGTLVWKRDGEPNYRFPWYDNIGMCYASAGRGLDRSNALRLELTAPGAVAGTPITFASTGLSWTNNHCSTSVVSGDLNITVGNYTDAEAQVADTFALDIRMTGTRYARVHWNASTSGAITELWLNDNYCWTLTASGSGAQSTEIDLSYPDNASMSSEKMQSIIPYEKPLDRSYLLNGVTPQRDAETQYYWDFSPLGWGVGRVLSIKLKPKTPNTVYKFNRVDLFRKSVEDGGFAKFYCLPAWGPWNDSRTVDDFAWENTGKIADANWGEFQVRMIRKGILIIDGVPVWELVSGDIREDVDEYYNELYKITLYKLTRGVSEGGIGVPLDSYTSPTKYDIHGVNVVVPSVAFGPSTPPAASDFIDNNFLVEYLEGGVYTPNASGVISIPIKIMSNGWNISAGSKFLPTGSYKRFRGQVEGLAYMTNGKPSSGSSITISTPNGSPNSKEITHVTANKLGFYISKALNTKGSADVETSIAESDVTLRSRYYSRLCLLAPAGTLKLRHCEDGKIKVGPTGKPALECGCEE